MASPSRRLGLGERLLFTNLVRLFVAVAGFGLLGFAVIELRSAAGWVDHSDRVLAQSSGAERSMIDLETGTRGYLITQHTLFLEPTRLAEARLPGQLAGLRRLVRDNPAQEHRAAGISAAIAEYRRDWLAPALNSSPNGLRQLGLLTRGKEQTDSLRGRFARFTRVEAGLRSRREAHSRLVQKVVAVLVVVMLAAMGIAALLSARWTRRRVVAPLVDLERIVERFGAGGLDARAATDGYAEIGRLASSFNSMAGELAETRRQEDMLTERLERQARSDPLTGLANRRRFDDELARACAGVQRHGTPLSLLSLDLDDFKAINDTLGHAAGDNVLKTVAAICVSNTRSSDLVARMGGDEFAALLTHTTHEGALTAAEHIRQALLDHTITGDGIRCSIGISTATVDADPHQLSVAADADMYRDKRSGRDHNDLLQRRPDDAGPLSRG